MSSASSLGAIQFTAAQNTSSGPLDGSNLCMLWIHWRCNLQYYEDGCFVRHKPLAGTVAYTPPTVDPLISAQELCVQGGVPVPGTQADTPDVIQQTAAPSGTVVIEGEAMRFGAKIVPPMLIQYAGITLGAPAKQAITQSVIDNIAGVPIYACAWRIEYMLPTLPLALPTPADPQKLVDGGF